jgi:hypothetical protein
MSCAPVAFRTLSIVSTSVLGHQLCRKTKSGERLFSSVERPPNIVVYPAKVQLLVILAHIFHYNDAMTAELDEVLTRIREDFPHHAIKHTNVGDAAWLTVLDIMDTDQQRLGRFFGGGSSAAESTSQAYGKAREQLLA